MAYLFGMKIDHIVLMATDLSASARFYDRVLPLLGFRKTREWVWVNEEGFAVDLRPAREDAPYRRYGPGLNHFAVAAPDARSVDAVREALIAAGMDAPEIQQFGEGRALFLPDPDGLRIEVGWEPADGV